MVTLSGCSADPSGRHHTMASAFRADPDINLPDSIQKLSHSLAGIAAFELLPSLDTEDQFQVL